MKRTYSVKFKNKNKMLKDEESIAQVKNTIIEETSATGVEIAEEGQLVTIEANDEEDYRSIMNIVVNVFRKLDDKSEVSYKFGLNRN